MLCVVKKAILDQIRIWYRCGVAGYLKATNVTTCIIRMKKLWNNKTVT